MSATSRLTDDEIRAFLNMSAFHDLVQKAFIAVLVSGRPVTADTVWAAAAFHMPPGIGDDARKQVRDNIDALLSVANALKGRN